MVVGALDRQDYPKSGAASSDTLVFRNRSVLVERTEEGSLKSSRRLSFDGAGISSMTSFAAVEAEPVGDAILSFFGSEWLEASSVLTSV